MIDFFVPGTPVTQGSKTAIVRHGRAVIVEGKTKEHRDQFQAWRHAVGTEARQATVRFNGPWPTEHPVIVTLDFGIQQPASAPKRRRTWPAKPRSGDIDKLARAVLDAITGVLVADDAQVIGLSATKRYARPGVHVRIWREDEHRVWTPLWQSEPIEQSA